jgi:hypothetical protein
LHDLSLDEARDFTFALRFFDGNIALAPTMRQDFRFWTQNGGWA